LYTLLKLSVFISSAVLSLSTCVDFEDNHYGDVFSTTNCGPNHRYYNKYYRNNTTSNDVTYIASDIVSCTLEIAV
jgi:hypothetical protein